jgi:hypothetical protein
MTFAAWFFVVLIAIESGGDDHARGRNGELGPLQIKQIVLDDVARFTGLQFTPEDCFDREKAIRIAKIYLNHYCTRERLGHEPTLEDAVRIWNGGPDGWAELSTKAHWRKFQAKRKQLGR